MVEAGLGDKMAGVYKYIPTHMPIHSPVCLHVHMHAQVLIHSGRAPQVRAARVLRRWHAYINFTNASYMMIKYIIFCLMLVHFSACGLGFVDSGACTLTFIVNDLCACPTFQFLTILSTSSVPFLTPLPKLTSSTHPQNYKAWRALKTIIPKMTVKSKFSWSICRP